MEYKNFTYNNFTKYLNLLKKIRDTINIKYECKYKKDIDKIVSLINIFCYLSDIEYNLTQIRLNNDYIEKYEE